MENPIIKWEKFKDRANRKPSGGKYKEYRKKRLCQTGRQPSLTRLDERKIIVRRILGGNRKGALLRTKTANVYDSKDKTYKKAVIKTIVENPANRHYVRRNIMNKGTVIETDLGKARITSRPGQHGTVNAVLIQ